MRQIASLLDKLIKPSLARYGLGQTKLLTEWNLIVGERIAMYSWPKKIVFPRYLAKDQTEYNPKSNGTLYIEVQNSGLNTEIYYMEGLILEKIAIYFGYKAITKLKVIVNPEISNTKTDHRKPPIKLLATEEENLHGQTEFIEDDALKSAFFQLGSQIINNQQRG